MSLTKNVLLGGSSLLAAGLIAVFSPTAAAAQATCTSGTVVTGNGTNTVTIAGGNPNNPGVTCNYVGDNATVSTLAATTVSTLTPGGGVNLTASGTDDIAWVSTAGTVTGGAQTNGPVISAINENGVITINTAGVTGSAATVSHGIYADSDTGTINITATGTVSATNSTSGQYGIQATTGGAINITTATVSAARNGILAESTGNGNIVLTTGFVGTGTSAAGNTAIEAISNGGAIAIITNGAIGTAGGSPTANAFNRDGVVATTSGAATVNLDLNSNVAGFGAGGAAVRVTNGTGLVTIDASGEVRGGSSDSSGAQLGSAFVIDSDGAITINSTSIIMGAINPTGAQPAAIVASGASFTLNLTGSASVLLDSVHSYQASLGGAYDSDGSGGNISGSISTDATNRRTGGHVDLSGITGGATLNFNTRSRWTVTEASLMSPGADVVNIDATSALMTAMQGPNPALLRTDVDQEIIRPGTIDFGAGQDVLNNDGRILIGPVYSSDVYVGEAPDIPPVADKRFGIRGEARLLNLEQFNNAGDIWLGSRFHRVVTSSLYITDQWHDDMLYMPGATFHGEEGSTIYMDVDLANAQTSCAPDTRDAEGYLPAADCLGLQGGAATGSTVLRIYEQVPGDRGSYNLDGIVLVDLAGGDPDDTDPDAFFLSADTPRYADIGDNGAIEKGIFAFVLGFDADDQQFKLYGIPAPGGQQLPMLATAANQLWHTATGGWFQRQVDQRDVERDDGLGTGAWFNVTGVNATRDIVTTIPIGTSEVDFDNTYDQMDVAISFGWDLISHNSAGASWSLGGMVGYAQSEIDFEATANTANLEGVHGGVYGGLSFGGAFVDAAVNGTWLSLHDDVPALNLLPGGTMLGTNVQSLGARIEAGWRWTSDMLWVEPIVGFSTVTTDFDDFRVPNDDPDLGRPGVGVRLENADSRRASVGVRVGLDDLMADTAPTSLSFTARHVNEFEGASDIRITNTGPDALMSDTLDGAFTQLTGSIGVSNAAKTLSGYLNVESILGDDYESLGVSAGLRLQW